MHRASLLTIAILYNLSVPLLADEGVNYTRQIKPILKERCFTCHGGLKQKGGLRLDTAKLIHEGGDTGPAITPGKDTDSLLIERITTKDAAKRMPPSTEGEPLTAAQIALLRQWIRQGAKGIANEQPEADPRDHWAFRKPVRPPVPAVKNQAWVRNPLDAFIAAEQEKQGLAPAPEAAKGLLLRRVYLDLIGLPPSREELHAFLTDPAPNAYEKVVDRLLASPHHGERWGRHWMDVWRYSDWYGRRYVPDVWNSAPQIWRWRDWIIGSLNKDKGYDRMLQEMLAADEIAPEDDEALVATGYIVRNWYALNPNQWMRDMVEHTGKAFLGLTFNCAHCHDHKYDPISQEEYFRFRAFFEPLELRQDRVPGEADPGPFQKYDYSVLRKIVKLGAIRVFDDKLDVKTHMYAGGDERSVMKDKPPVRPGGPAFLGGERLKIAPVELPLHAYYPGLKPYAQKDEIARREQEVKSAQEALAKAKKEETEIARAHLESARAELQAFQARVSAANAAHGKSSANVDELAHAAAKTERVAAHLFVQERLLQAEQAIRPLQQEASKKTGKEKDAILAKVKKQEALLVSLKKNQEQAQKNLALTDGKYTPLSPIYPKTSTGRRKALAEWLTSKANPLTARVAVNHLWLRHFDRALVETVFDFGRNGKKPSHPELLDWLAVEFMESGWSMRHMHRLIVTSAAYRLQSAAGSAGSENQARDPDNHFYWHANAKRMEAEIVRDSVLATAGELDRQVGGMVLENSQETTSKRRSLYFSVYPEDSGHLKFLEIFDAPDPCDCYKRTTSVMPQQALALTNNQLALQASRMLARKLSEKKSDEAFIASAFEHLLSRLPTNDEALSSREFLQKQRELYAKVDPKELKAPAGSVSAPSVDPVIRARESLIRVLYNHNDFITAR